MKRLGILVIAAMTLVLSACGNGVVDNEASGASATTSSAASTARTTTPRTTTPRSTTPPPPPPPFTIECYEQTFSGPLPTYTSLEQVWGSGKQFSTCAVELSATYAPTPTDLEAVALYQQFVPSETVTGALDTMLAICAAYTAPQEDILRWQAVVVRGATLLCPNAPHIGLMQPYANGELVDDGTYIVGQDVQPGIWSTAPEVRDCYWERTSGGGDIIANNFINFAPDGATVTIRASDGGFISEGCGIWRRTG